MSRGPKHLLRLVPDLHAPLPCTVDCFIIDVGDTHERLLRRVGMGTDAVIYAKQAICVFNQPNVPPKSRDTHGIIEYECANFEETLASRFDRWQA